MDEKEAKGRLRVMDWKLYTAYVLCAAIAYGSITLVWPYLSSWGAPPGLLYRSLLTLFVFWGAYNLRWLAKMRSERDRLRVMAGEVHEEHHHH